MQPPPAQGLPLPKESRAPTPLKLIQYGQGRASPRDILYHVLLLPRHLRAYRFDRAVDCGTGEHHCCSKHYVIRCVQVEEKNNTSCGLWVWTLCALFAPLVMGCILGMIPIIMNKVQHVFSEERRDFLGPDGGPTKLALIFCYLAASVVAGGFALFSSDCISKSSMLGVTAIITW